MVTVGEAVRSALGRCLTVGQSWGPAGGKADHFSCFAAQLAWVEWSFGVRRSGVRALVTGGGAAAALEPELGFEPAELEEPPAFLEQPAAASEMSTAVAAATVRDRLVRIIADQRPSRRVGVGLSLIHI